MKIKYGEGRFSVALSDKASFGSAGKILGAFSSVALSDKASLGSAGKILGAFSSVGRALPLQGRCREFEPLNAHHLKKDYRNVVFFVERRLSPDGSCFIIIKPPKDSFKTRASAGIFKFYAAKAA